jgi:hypothetical protein
MQSYSSGDCVVYRKIKRKSRPARRARNVQPSPKGETYAYEIDKYCRVLEVDREGNVVLLTRRSGPLTVAASDPNLRKAKWWERRFRIGLFPPWPPTDSADRGE